MVIVCNGGTINYILDMTIYDNDMKQSNIDNM